MKERVSARDLIRELVFSTSRSGGPGGQNVNKVNSKVTLYFNVVGSQVLKEEEKKILLEKYPSKINSDGFLILSSSETRSQMENKELVMDKLDDLFGKAFRLKKQRKSTNPTKASVNARLQAKKKLSDKKKWRQKPD